MSTTGKILIATEDGFPAVQHHFWDRDNLPVDLRHVPMAIRVDDRLRDIGDVGTFRYRSETYGDVIGPFLWINASENESRPISGWQTHWPVMSWSRDPSDRRINRVKGEDDPGIPTRLKFTTWQFPLNMVKTRGQGGDEEYARDINFAKEEPFYDPFWNRMPGGHIGMIVDSTNEDAQIPMYLSTDPRLYAVNVDGDPQCGTLVCDLNEHSEIDVNRSARLQSFFRVGRPREGCFSWTGQNVLAWQLGKAEKDGIEGIGMVCESRVIPTPAAITPDSPKLRHIDKVDKAKERNVIFAAAGAIASGPFVVGLKEDKHRIGLTADQEPINSLGLSIDTYFRIYQPPQVPGANVPTVLDLDASLDFDITTAYKAKVDLPFRQKVHLRYDFDAKHNHICGEKDGKWRWETGSYFIKVPPCEEPPGVPTPTPPPTPPDIPTRPGTTPPPPPPVTGGGDGGPPIPFPPGPGPEPVTDPGDAGGPIVSPPSPTGSLTGTDTILHELTRQRVFDDVKQTRKEHIPTRVLDSLDQPFFGVQISDAPDRKEFSKKHNIVIRSQCGDNRTPIATPYDTSFSGLIFRPSETWEGATDYRYDDEETVIPASLFGERPATMKFESYAAKNGREWTYTQRPCQSMFSSGTSTGGIIVFTPETDIGDEMDNQSETATDWPGLDSPPKLTEKTQSESTMIFTPGTQIAVGRPDMFTGKTRIAHIWRDNTALVAPFLGASTEWVRTDAAGAETQVMELAFVGLTIRDNYRFRSGTSFIGALSHNITANRTWIFPDISGTVALMSSPASGIFTAGSVIFAGSDGLLTQDNPNFFFDDGVLGIGVPSPSPSPAKLHIGDILGSLPALPGQTMFIIQNNKFSGTAAGMVIIAGDAGLARIGLGDDALASSGALEYDNSINRMRIRTANATGISIDSSQNVAIDRSTPTSKLDVNGSLATAIRTATVTTTLDIDDFTLLMNNAAGATVNLPTAVGITGRIYTIKKISATGGGRQVTVDGNGTETIDGSLTVVLNTSDEFIVVQSDGSNWRIIG